MRLCWRRAAAMWYRDDGVSPLGSCGNKKHQMNMITDSDLVQEKGEQTQLCNIMFTMCKPLLFYSFRVFDHSRFLLLLFIWKKVMTENSTWHSSHLVWVSEYYSMITWTKTKGRVIRTVAMPTDILCTATTNVQKQWLEIFLKFCPALAVFQNRTCLTWKQFLTQHLYMRVRNELSIRGDICPHGVDFQLLFNYIYHFDNDGIKCISGVFLSLVTLMKAWKTKLNRNVCDWLYCSILGM